MEVILSTWGTPALTEEEVRRYFPKLRLLLYSAASVRYFAEGYLKAGVTVVTAAQAIASDDVCIGVGRSGQFGFAGANSSERNESDVHLGESSLRENPGTWENTTHTDWSKVEDVTHVATAVHNLCDTVAEILQVFAHKCVHTLLTRFLALKRVVCNHLTSRISLTSRIQQNALNGLFQGLRILDCFSLRADNLLTVRAAEDDGTHRAAELSQKHITFTHSLLCGSRTRGRSKKIHKDCGNLPAQL